VLRELATGRLLVPVVALLEDVEMGEDGLARDKQSAMAAVLTQTEDGRRSLLAFTSLDSLRRWQVDARPVPVSGIGAAQSALADGAAALLLDVAGPTPFAVTGDELQALAEAHRAPSRSTGDANAHAVVAELVEQELGLLDARLRSAGAGAQLTLVVEPTLPDDAYRALLARVTKALQRGPALMEEFPDGLQVTVVGPDLAAHDRGPET